ncbi:DNA polymerase III subunit delta [Myxococcota bacterium]|nr:DNA polymerase III subunit delta [Myxococcota bacterium]
MPIRKDFDKHASSEELLPVYVLTGEEALLLNEAVSTLKKRALTAAPDFNQNDFTLGEVSIQEVVDAASTLPMMAERRWVLLRNIQKIKSADQATLLDYIKNPSPSSVLCITGTKIDGRSALSKALTKAGYRFDFEAPGQRNLQPWINTRARKKGYKINPDAAGLLADLIGPEIGTLDMALDKAATWAGQGKVIELEAIEETVAPTRVEKIFALTDAIGRRDLPEATRLVHNALDGGSHGLMVLTMIARQLRHLIKIKSLPSSARSNQEIAKAVGIMPFVVDNLQRQARQYGPGELEKALLSVARADLRFKSTRLSGIVILDRLLIEIMDGE